MEQEQNNAQPTPVTPEPVEENAFPSAGTANATSNYALIGGLVGLAVIALGAWYTMKGSTPEVAPVAPFVPEIVVTPTPEATPTTEVAPDAAVETMKVQGTSDELGAIEADLNATDMGTLNDINKI